MKKGPDKKELLLLYKLLYSISRKELLIFKKILKDLLNKGFIRANNSEVGILILFIRKLGNGLRFYYNY